VDKVIIRKAYLGSNPALERSESESTREWLKRNEDHFWNIVFHYRTKIENGEKLTPQEKIELDKAFDALQDARDARMEYGE